MERIDGSGNLIERRDYAGSFLFEGESLSEVLTGEGRLIPWRMVKPDFFVRDHLGSVRAVVSGDGRVLEENSYYPYGLQIKPLSRSNYAKSDIRNRYKYNGKEEFADLQWLNYGARFYDAAVGRFWTRDRYSEKYSLMSPYQYAGNSPVTNIDVNGDSVYVIFDGKEKMLYIYNDNNTRYDYSDDMLIASYKAHNIVSSKSKGKWEDGIYQMLDQNFPYTHGDRVDDKGIKLDSKNGAYGAYGIFRAKNIKETTTGLRREGMGIHSGRAYLAFEKRKTLGCIRTTDKAMETLQSAIDEYGVFHTLIVRNNRKSINSDKVRPIKPGYKPIVIPQVKSRDKTRVFIEFQTLKI